MRKLKVRGSNSSARIGRFALVGFIITLFALGAAISLRSSQAKDRVAQSHNSAPVTYSRKNQSALHLAAQQNDAGQIRPLTQAEAEQLAEGLRGMVNKSSEGLKEVRQADGSTTVDLEGRFQNVTLAKKTETGVATTCVDNLDAAAAFLGVDANIIKNQPGSGAAPKQPRKPASGEINR